MAVKAIPDGYHSITPYLYVRDAASAMDFWKNAFGAVEVVRMPGPDGKVMHGEMRIGNSMFMIGEENEEWKARSPLTLGGASGGYAIYCEDSDALFNQAVAAGATVMRPMADQFYGDRSGTVIDPYGHVWTLGTHKEDVTPEQMQQRMDEFMKNPK